MVELIHHLGSTAVAVGLETIAEVSQFREMDCDIGQGNYFGEPLAFDEFLAFLKKPPHRLSARVPARDEARSTMRAQALA